LARGKSFTEENSRHLSLDQKPTQTDKIRVHWPVTAARSLATVPTEALENRSKQWGTKSSTGTRAGNRAGTWARAKRGKTSGALSGTAWPNCSWQQSAPSSRWTKLGRRKRTQKMSQHRRLNRVNEGIESGNRTTRPALCSRATPDSGPARSGRDRNRGLAHACSPGDKIEVARQRRPKDHASGKERKTTGDTISIGPTAADEKSIRR
jgi:hypothetical protein